MIKSLDLQSNDLQNVNNVISMKLKEYQKQKL